MNDILTKVQFDLNKLQKTLEREGEVLISKIKDAANRAATNKNVAAKRKEFEQLFDNQMRKLEPAFGKLYKDLKTTAGKYGVNFDKIEKSVLSTTERAAERLHIKTKKPAASPSPKAKAGASSERASSVGATKKASGTGPKKKRSSKKA